MMFCGHGQDLCALSDRIGCVSEGLHHPVCGFYKKYEDKTAENDIY